MKSATARVGLEERNSPLKRYLPPIEVSDAVQDIKVSDAVNCRISKWQTHCIAGYQSVRCNESQDIKVSEAMNCRMWHLVCSLSGREFRSGQNDLDRTMPAETIFESGKRMEAKGTSVGHAVLTR